MFLMSIPPKTDPQNFPNPWWMPCRNPWADGLRAVSVLWTRKLQQAAQTAAWVMPAGVKQVFNTWRAEKRFFHRFGQF